MKPRISTTVHGVAVFDAQVTVLGLLVLLLACFDCDCVTHRHRGKNAEVIEEGIRNGLAGHCWP